MRWFTPSELTVAGGQEFACDVGDDLETQAWTEEIAKLIQS